MTITAQCHCGKNQYKIEGDIPEKLTRCTCSFCSKRGMLYAYFKPKQFTLLSSESERSEYRWRSKTCAHYFCKTCGCTTYSHAPAYGQDGTWDQKTYKMACNARLFDNFVAEDHPVFVIDGKNLW